MTEGPLPKFPTPVHASVSADLEAVQRAAVVKAALSWVGTPYRQCGAVKGPLGAVDCSMLLVEAWIEAGVFERFDPRPYSPTWFLHRSEERYLAWLDTIGERTTAKARPGDVVTFQVGRCVAHAAIVVDDYWMVHAYANARQCIKTERFWEPLKDRERASFDMWARLRSTK